MPMALAHPLQDQQMIAYPKGDNELELEICLVIGLKLYLEHLKV